MDDPLPSPPVQSVAADATPESVVADLSYPDLQPVAHLSERVQALVDSLSPSSAEPWHDAFVGAAPPAGVLVYETLRVPLDAVVRVGHVTVDATVAGVAEIFLGALVLNTLVAAFPVPVGGAVYPFPELLVGPTDFLTVRVTGGAGNAIRVGLFGSQTWSR